jgi:hypothetical protein
MGQFSMTISAAAGSVLSDNQHAPTKEKTEKLWSFVFQKRPTYQELVDGTPDLTLIYRLNRDIGADENLLAGHLSNGWNTFDTQFRTGLEADLP